jgi:hypothetical protein
MEIPLSEICNNSSRYRSRGDATRLSKMLSRPRCAVCESRKRCRQSQRLLRLKKGMTE